MWPDLLKPRHLGADLPAIDEIGPFFERLGEFAERLVEHRAHQQPEHAAGEFIGNEEGDLASGFMRLEGPAVFQIAEGPIDIFDQNLEIGRIELRPEVLNQRRLEDGKCVNLPDGKVNG